jgi:hypothetical protein
MSVRVYQVTHTFMNRLMCDECEKQGHVIEMKPGGIVLKNYQHICPKCGHRALKDKPYPQTEMKLVELQQVESDAEHPEQEMEDDAKAVTLN